MMTFRCSPALTLTLGRQLAEAGLDVITPTTMERRRSPRRRKVVVREVALLPSFLFLEGELPPWARGVRPMVVNGGHVQVARGELLALQDRAREGRAWDVPQGQRVVVAYGPLRGRVGRAMDRLGGVVLLELDGAPGVVKVSPSLLLPI